MTKDRQTESALPTRFGDRFEPISTTPRQLAAMATCDEESIRTLTVDGVAFKPSTRFFKTLAAEMDVSYGVYALFTPQEVLARAAERNPNLRLRLTVDTDAGTALGVTPDKGPAMPIRFIENVLREDGRLNALTYADGLLSAMLDLGEGWNVNRDSDYRMHVRCRVPVDGVGMPDMSLSTWRQVCSNGAVAESPMFRSKMEIKDNSGEHFRRLLASFSNPLGVEQLERRMCAAAETKASVGELVLLEGLIRRSVSNTRNQLLLRERLYEVAANPCVRYGVTDLSNIGAKKRALLPVGCSVSDLLNFASELTTHHRAMLKPSAPLETFFGTLLGKGFDLEDLYPNATRMADFYLKDLDFSQEAA